MVMIGLNSLTEEEEPASLDIDEELDTPPPLPKLHTYKQEMESLEDVKIFLEHRGCLEQASIAASPMSELATSHSHTHTSTIHSTTIIITI